MISGSVTEAFRNLSAYPEAYGMDLRKYSEGVVEERVLPEEHGKVPHIPKRYYESVLHPALEAVRKEYEAVASAWRMVNGSVVEREPELKRARERLSGILKTGTEKIPDNVVAETFLVMTGFSSAKRVFEAMRRAGYENRELESVARALSPRFSGVQRGGYGVTDAGREAAVKTLERDLVRRTTPAPEASLTFDPHLRPNDIGGPGGSSGR